MKPQDSINDIFKLLSLDMKTILWAILSFILYKFIHSYNKK